MDGWFVLASAAAVVAAAVVAAAAWLFTPTTVPKPIPEVRPEPSKPMPKSSKTEKVRWLAGVVAHVSAHVVGVPMAIRMVRKYNPNLTPNQERMLGRMLARAIDGYANNKSVEPHLMAALAVAVPNGSELAKLVAELTAAFRDVKKQSTTKTDEQRPAATATATAADAFEHPTKPNRPSTDIEPVRPSAPAYEPDPRPAGNVGPVVVDDDDRKFDDSAFADLKSAGVDCSAPLLKSFDKIWLAALLSAIRQKPIPVCPFTLDDLIDDDGRLIGSVAAVFQPRSSIGQPPHVYLYRTSALTEWFSKSKSDWNPTTREPIDRRRHVLEIS